MFAAPDWGRFIERHTRPSRTGRKELGILVSQDQCQINYMLEFAYSMYQTVDQMSVRRRIIRPWQATYWKQLPYGHLVAYRYNDIELSPEADRSYLWHLMENRSWCRWR